MVSLNPIGNDAPSVLVMPPLRSARRSGSARLDNELSVAELTKLLTETGGIAVFRADQQGRVSVCNDAFRALNQTFAGSDADIRIPGFQSGIEAALCLRREVTRPQAMVVDGETRQYWTRYVPVLNDGGAATAVIGSLQNWTAQLGRMQGAAVDQARFRDFARASSDWFWETDEGLRITALSDRLTALLGVPAVTLTGKPLKSLGRFEPNMVGEHPFDNALADYAPFRSQLLILEDAAGLAHLFHLSGVPVFDESGRFKGYRGAGMDVTRTYFMEEQTRSARRNLEDALSELRRKNEALDVASGQAQEALEAKNEFLAAMSHELRTPLNAIIGFAEAIQMQVFGELAPHYVAYANDIVTAGYHLLGLINDVLDVSVIESGEVSLVIEPVSLASLVDQARSLLLLRAEAKSLNLSAVQCKPDVYIMADERRALQILVNLLTNAVKFTPERGRIGLEVVEVAGSGSMVSFTIWDTGPGIAAENHERVFEKFQQCVTDAYIGKPEGTGLGLHISRRLARLMGGDITVVSEVGKGARFTVNLPLA